MKETEIRSYAQLMRELDLTAIELTEDNRKIRLERTIGIAVPSSMTVQNIAEPTAVAAPAEVQASSDTVSVPSPFVGVFYAASAENADPYVKVGDTIAKGQTLCVVEAMKLMNEITAEFDGTIEEVCVTNGQVVEYGTELFRVRRTA